MKICRALFLTIVLFFSFATAAWSEIIALRADSWYPYNGDPQAEKPGFMIEIARAVFEAAGHTVDYQVIPWTRALKDAELGNIDGVVGAARGDAPNFVFPNTPQGQTRYAFFTLANSTWNYKDPTDLQSVVVGMISDYSYGPTFDAWAKARTQTKQLQTTNGDTALEQNIKKLQRGRIDVLISSPDVFNWTVGAMGMAKQDFRQAGMLPEVDDIFIAFSPKRKSSDAYAKLLADGVLKLRADGRLATILARYGVSDWN
jgi:polar amino acid transport system substrate-binding protein